MSAPVNRQFTHEDPDFEGAPLLRTSAVVTVGVDGALVAELHLNGDLGPSTAEALRCEIERLIDDGVIELTMDLAGLRLCTSHGLDIWQDADERLRRAGGGVRLVNASGSVRHVLDVVADADPSFTPAIHPLT